MYLAPNWIPLRKSECFNTEILKRSHLRLRANPDGSHSIVLHPGIMMGREIHITTFPCEVAPITPQG